MRGEPGWTLLGVDADILVYRGSTNKHRGTSPLKDPDGDLDHFFCIICDPPLSDENGSGNSSHRATGEGGGGYGISVSCVL